MIYFYCPECRDELEAEDSIRGTRMKCPACWKEISVPQVGVAFPARPGRRSAGGRVWIAIGICVLLSALGVGGYFLARHLRRDRPAEGSACTQCEGTGRRTCGTCEGKATRPCKGECKGTGTVIHERSGQKTNCADCGGTGKRACEACSGYGYVGCPACRGTGRAE